MVMERKLKRNMNLEFENTKKT